MNELGVQAKDGYMRLFCAEILQGTDSLLKKKKKIQRTQVAQTRLNDVMAKLSKVILLWLIYSAIISPRFLYNRCELELQCSVHRSIRSLFIYSRHPLLHPFNG